MNILFYCSEYPPYRTGGIGNVTKVLAEALAKRGHTIVVAGYYCNGLENVSQEEEVAGVHIYRYDLGWRNNRVKSKMFSLLRKMKLDSVIIQREIDYIENEIEGLIHRYSIDIIELTDFFRFNLDATQKLRFKKFKVPVILRIHGCSFALKRSLNGTEDKTIWKNDLNHFKRCDYISSVSKFSLQNIIQDFPELQTFPSKVLYNPINDCYLDNKVTTDNNVILFVGKVTESKGCFHLIKAFNQIGKFFPTWTLRLAGGGNIEYAKGLVASDLIERVKFLGYIGKKEVEEEIRSCTFACIPTYYENFSMVALEIMAKSKALIYTKEASGNEVIEDGVDGLLVNPFDIEEISIKLKSLIINEAFRNSIAHAAYIKIHDKFCVSTMIEEFEKYYMYCAKR